MESDLKRLPLDPMDAFKQIERSVADRHDAETVLDALYHRLQTLARSEPGGINGDGAVQLRTLAARLRAVLDRTPEMYAHLQSEGHKAASFVYADDEGGPELYAHVAGKLIAASVRETVAAQGALQKAMQAGRTADKKASAENV